MPKTKTETMAALLKLHEAIAEFEYGEHYDFGSYAGYKFKDVPDDWQGKIEAYRRSAAILKLLQKDKREERPAREALGTLSFGVFVFLRQLWGGWPDNAYVGATVCNGKMFSRAWDAMVRVKAAHKWLSIEPLMDWDMSMEDTAWTLTSAGIEWVVIGALDHPLRLPKLEWVKTIVEACDKAGVKVWIKNNMRELLIPENCRQPNGLMFDGFWASDKAKMRQELPWEVVRR